MKEILTELLERYQHLSDYAETKLGVIVAFNTAIIIGVGSIIKDQEKFIKYYLIFAILMNCISIFFAFSGLIAKKRNSHSSTNKTETKNYYYYKYVAQLNEHQFLENISKDYNLNQSNSKQEQDLSNQIVVLARNAERKFYSFNIALKFTIVSLITPIGLLIFNIYKNPNWL